jgi:lipopolysaccharide export LptBFGC system permease protein LptF
MLSTISSVKEYTGYDVTLPLILRAQAIIEMFVGKDEIDVENPSDFLLLDKMVSYQTAYMLENEDIVFKQAALTSQGQTDALINFNRDMFSPFIAPLAVMAAAGLSFNKSRSYKTGSIFQKSKYRDWKKD